MKLQLQTGAIAGVQTPLAIVGVWAGEPLPAPFDVLLEQGEWSGGFKKTLLLHTAGASGIAARRVLLLGLGKRDEATLEQLRRAFAYASIQARDSGAKHVAVALPSSEQLDANSVLRAVGEGVLLAAYRFNRFRGTASAAMLAEQSNIDTLTLVGEGDERLLEQVEALARGVTLARDLGNEPPATCTPTRLAEVAAEIAERGGMELTVLDRPQMEELGMGGMLGVSQAAHEPPKVVVLEYGRKGEGKTLALVGKGITFDSGGISLKPGEKMDLMKMDMMGAAAVLGAMSAVAELKPDGVHVVAVVCATENLPGGKAFKPGDILRAMNGVTMEILNTDAEGRLVLADGLSYVQRYEPDAIVDLATLTGAVTIALGNQVSGLITNDAPFAERVKRAGTATGELVWELPLLPEYRQAVRSKVADIKNTAGRPAGSITAGAFLEHFVDGRPWVHLDIAGTSWIEEPPKAEDQAKPYNTAGAVGVGVRLLVELVETMNDER